MSPKPETNTVRSNAAIKALPVKTNSKPAQRSKDKPKRPLSAYNLFFQHERDRLLRGIQSPFGFAHDANHCTLGRDPSKRANRSKKVRPPPHGKIGFAQLAKTIGANWKKLDDESRSHFESLAATEKARYRREIEIWKRKRIMGEGCDAAPPSLTSSKPLSPPTIVTPPSFTGADRLLPPLPPPVAGYSVSSEQSYHPHQQYHYQGHQYYNNCAGVPPPPPLSYNNDPTRTPSPAYLDMNSAPAQQQQKHNESWLGWNSGPQSPSEQCSFSSHYGESSYEHHHQQQVSYANPYPTHEQQQQQGWQHYVTRAENLENKCDGALSADMLFPSHHKEDAFAPDPIIPSRAEEKGAHVQEGIACSNPTLPRDVLDFLAEFVCEA